MAAPLSSWEKFRLLLWKNWIIQWNSKWSLLLEISLPIFFIILLVGVRAAIPTKIVKTTQFNKTSLSSLATFEENWSHFRGSAKKEIYYAPKNQIFEQIVREAVDRLKLNGYKAFENANDLEAALVSNDVLAGVQFDDALHNISSFPIEFTFRIRQNAAGSTWLKNRLFRKMSLLHSDFNSSFHKAEKGYMQNEFLAIQHAISMAFIKLASGVDKLPDIVVQAFPDPEHIEDLLLSRLRFIISFIIVLCFAYPAGVLVKNITVEHEKQLREIMKMMGLQNWIHWSAWFVRAVITWAISAFIISLLLKVSVNGSSILEKSSWSIVLFFLWIYIGVSICYCFMIANFFNKANIAASVGTFVWFLMYAPFLLYNSDQFSIGAKVLCLLPNSALGMGINLILEYEQTGEGLQWHNFFMPITLDDDSLATYIGIMLLSAFIFLMICLYIEQIFPGEYGMPKRWYFLFTRNYWQGEQYFGDYAEKTWVRNSLSFEQEPVDKYAGLSLRNLRKTFGNKPVVKDLTVNMYQDEITVLLGHNGAGKTTTISMLCGMVPPTAGAAIVNGYNISTNIEEARSSIGICLQHDVLFEKMSLAEHIEFFSYMKGVRGYTALQAEVQEYLEVLSLEDKADELVKNLSSGMKRKLSMCCALCGDAKVVLCDEPSSGMDPASRRQLWELLQKEKIGRTILLTTHAMDEADALADRIAIMCDGELKCSGSPFFLKKKYGTGYKLICIKGENCNTEEVTDHLQQTIPDIKPQTDCGAELIYLLPELDISKFERMLDGLEKMSEELDLSSFSIGITSMEEVFMKVGKENKTYVIEEMEARLAMHFSTEDLNLLTGFRLYKSQCLAILFKNMIYTWRNICTFAFQLLVPILIIVLAIESPLASQILNGFRLIKPMTFSPTQYPEETTILEAHLSANDSLATQISENYKSILSSYGEHYAIESTGNASFQDYLLSISKTQTASLNTKYIIAATINETSITAWINKNAYHAAPLAINLAHNALAKTLLDNNTEIKVTNAPLPLSMASQDDHWGNDFGDILDITLCFIMCFVTSFYVIFVIKERVSNAKLLQFVSGLRIWLFWITQFLWDYLTFIVIALTTIGTIACFQMKGFSTVIDLGYLFLVLIIFGLSAIPFAYLTAFVAKQPAIGFSRSFVINLFCGLALFVVYKVLQGHFTANILYDIFRVFPHFSLASAIEKLYKNSKDTCKLKNPNICLEHPSCCETMLWELLYMLITGAIFLLIVILSEYRFFENILEKLRNGKRRPPQHNYRLAEDVERERIRISKMCKTDFKAHNLIVDSLTKYYNSFRATDQVCFAVDSLECFGLLGANGAGKTTIFKMLTGEESITFGDIFVKGTSLRRSLNNVHREIGYCPQYDALLSDLTARDTLRIFCLIRGLPLEHISVVSLKIAVEFGLIKHLDIPIKEYSVGTKRKLSLALAILANPTVIYLDEPTTGMDPVSRRQLWNMICSMRDIGKSIVLTSHSMQECEALCTKLAIMVNGELKCLDSTQNLKQQHSKGLAIKLKIKRETQSPRRINSNDANFKLGTRTLMDAERNRIVDLIKEFFAHQFPKSVLCDEFQDILTFHVPMTNIKWSQVFAKMEQSREKLKIEDYSISQITLEEIFLNFVKMQRKHKRQLE